jgi:hypothetical protein
MVTLSPLALLVRLVSARRSSEDTQNTSDYF